MSQQHTLHFDRRNVLAGAADDIFLAIDEIEIAARVPPHDVTGMEPSTRPSFRRRIGILQIFLEEAVARIGPHPPDEKFTRHIRRNIASGVVDDASFCFRAGAAKAVGANVARLVHGRDDHRAACLGHCPRLEQRKPEARLEGRVHARVDPGAEAEADRVVRVVCTWRRRHQHRRHDAEVVNDARPRRAYRWPPGLRMETVEHNQTPARENHRHRRGDHGVGVKQRERGQHPLSAHFDPRIAADVEIPAALVEIVGIRQHATFRSTSGA